MPPELLQTVANWGFPALLCLYLLSKADRLLTPLATEALTLIRDISRSLASATERLSALSGRVDEGTIRALNDHEDIHESVKEHNAILVRIDATTLEILKRVPQAIHEVKQ